MQGFQTFDTVAQMRAFYRDLGRRMSALQAPPPPVPPSIREIEARPYRPPQMVEPPPPPPARPFKLTPFQRILLAVCEEWGVQPSGIRVDSRLPAILIPRYVVIYLARSHTQMSPKAIAVALNRKDHTTVHNAVRALELRMIRRPELAERVQRVRAKLLEVSDR